MAYWQDVETIESKQLPTAMDKVNLRRMLTSLREALLREFERYWPETEWEDAEPSIRRFMGFRLDAMAILDYEIITVSGWEMTVRVRTVDRSEFQGDWVSISAHLQQMLISSRNNNG